MLEINYTLLIQVITFLLIVFFLNATLYKPIRNILGRRQQEMTSLESSVEEARRKAEEFQRQVAEGQVAARREGFAEKERLKSQGLEQEKEMLQEAASRVDERLKAARAEMDEKVGEVRRALEGELSQFSRELAEKILGRSVA